MVAIIVICVLIMLVAFLLSFNLRAEIKYLDSRLDFKIKYMFFIIYPLKEKKKKTISRRKRRNKKIKKGIKSDETENSGVASGGEDKNSISNSKNKFESETVKDKVKLSERIDGIFEIIEKAKIILECSNKGMKRVFNCIHLDDLTIDFTVACGDAYDTAMAYGKISAAVYNIISAIRMVFPLTVKTVDIACDFNGKESVYDGEIKVKMRVLSLFRGGFSVLWGVFKNWKKLKGTDTDSVKEKQTTEKETVNA